METKAKKRLSNVIMVVLILVIAVSGVLTVGKIQGWFEDEEQTVMVSNKVKGVANIERNGIGYTLNSDTGLQSGDIIETKKGAETELLLQDTNSFTLNGNTEAVLSECSAEKTTIQMELGELFGAAADYQGTLEVSFDGNQAMLSGAVFSVSAQTGSSILNVYSGDVSVILSDRTQERVEAGEYLSVVHEEDGTISYEIRDLQMASLSEFLIHQAQNCRNAEELCFRTADLQGVLDAREAEKQAALQASLQAERIRHTETEAAEKPAEESTDRAPSAGDGADAQGTVQEYVPEDNRQAVVQEAAEDIQVCTITILCDTILDNMDNLDDGKEAYVPANGTILAASSVEFEEGETVFDVLNRVCEYAGIQLEYSWTPMYNSYYIEGINNLYEFDCGNESGWMYKVNGWFPNYGCSSYSLEDGDNIVWCYTCNGLGADVGGSVY